MSRSGYSDDGEYIGLWRGAVDRAISGKRGQKLLRDMAAGLDAMPEKKLVANELQTETGEVCALGAVGLARGMDMKNIDAEEPLYVSDAFDIAYALACEVAWVNDEACYAPETPEERWLRVRAWVTENLIPDNPVKAGVSE